METGTASEGGELQFDKVEYSGTQEAAARCGGCERGIEDTYFEVNGTLLCPPCKEQVEQAFVGGSKLRRFVLATVFGSIVAALGSGLWYAVRALTEYEVGLISVVIGIGVGKAVSRGSGGRGGWPYQALAVFLTYTAVAMTYVPLVVKGMMDEPAGESVAAAASDAPSAAAPGRTTVPSYAPDEALPPNAEPPDGPATEAPVTGVGAVVALAVFSVFVLAISYAAPFLAGFDNIIGLLIIGFGLFEAWRYNKRLMLSINGPLRIGAGEPAAEAEAEKHG